MYLEAYRYRQDGGPRKGFGREREKIREGDYSNFVTQEKKKKEEHDSYR